MSYFMALFGNIIFLNYPHIATHAFSSRRLSNYVKIEVKDLSS